MRKYKKQILWVIVVPISITFIYWGASMGPGRGDFDPDSFASVAVVEGMPIAPAELRSAMDAEVQQRNRFGGETRFADLVADGTAQRVLERLISRRLIEAEASKLRLDFEREYLIERLKDQFKDEQGRFDAERWNSWVEYMQQSIGQSWHSIYAQEAETARKQLVLAKASASARVLESDLRKQFEMAHTKIDMKYALVEPAIEPAEDEVRAHYDANPSAYDIPARRRADFVAISLAPPAPAFAQDIVAKARGGADLAALAQEHPEVSERPVHIDRDWLTLGDDTPEYERVVFSMKPGDVSDPVAGPEGMYFIYKVEDERPAESGEGRDVKVRQLFLRATLGADERAALDAKAAAVAAQAAETGDLVAVATEAGLEVRTSGLFSVDSTLIENIPQSDAWRFASSLAEFEPGVVSDVIAARANLYVAKIVEAVPAEPQPFEAVRDKVREDAIAATRRSPEYRESARGIAAEIVEQGGPLEDAAAKRPELAMKVEEVTGFSLADRAGATLPPWNPSEVYMLVENQAPGALVGPVQDYMGRSYAIEFLAKIPPNDLDWEEKWPEEKELYAGSALRMARDRRLDDYLRYLRETRPWSLNPEVFSAVLGLGEDDPDAEAPLPEAEAVEAEPVEDAPAPDTAAQE